MAYALRYYKELKQADGSTIRLEIHKKDSTAGAIEIGAVVQGLSLEIQGSQGDVDSPIVKTSLSMTFVDASDIENGQKNGFWEEFYTPDALLWKVILKAKDAQETAFRTMWGGYVTPDSFSESLVYRGSVNIIARDNIGHMQDFPFDAQGDADGLISLYNLVNMAWEKIQSPMDLEWNPNQMMVCDGVPAYDTLMNVSQFEGMDWYKAVESALASYGMVMRYTGDNEVHIGALRYLPNLGYVDAGSVPHQEPVFVTGAQRELVPAVRRIEESVDYEAGEVNAPQVDSSDFTGDINSTLLTTSTGVQFYLDSWDITNTEEGEGWVDNGVSAPYFNPEGYDMTELVESDSHDGRFMWLAFSQYITGGNRYALYSRRMMAGRISVRFAFGPTYRLVDSRLTPIGSARADYAVVAIEVVSGSSRYFLQEDGTWGSALDMLTYRGEQMQDGELVLDLPADEFDGGVILNIRIYEAGYYSWSQDSYVPLYALSFTANNVMMEKNSVNTIYNADNNVILSRSPEIGPAYDRVSFPGFIKNGIFLRDGDEILPARNWGWSGGSMHQMAVWNHLQLLSYFAKPNNLISGTIVNADITRVGVLYQWHGAEHMLMSGRYNFLNGFIENAVLREFARYEDMWSEVAGAALPETEEEGTTNVESGASSGGSSPIYTNTTTVNIGTGGSGGGGASYLNDLLDVSVEDVTPLSLLFFNGTEWVAQTKAVFMSDHERRLNALESMWTIDDDGNVRTKHNVVSEGEISAGGAGEESNDPLGTTTGIEVNGETWYPDDNGTIKLPDYPTSLNWGDINGRPTKLSQFENDRGFATAQEVDSRIESLIGGAPEALDTLKEIADALSDNDDAIAGIVTTLGTKASKDELKTVSDKHDEDVARIDGEIEGLKSKDTQHDAAISNIQETDTRQDESLESLDERVTTNEDEISDMAELRAWYERTGKYIDRDEHGIYTGENFRSYKEISAGGIGTESDEEGGSGSDTLDGLLDVEIGDMSDMTSEEKESQVVGYDNTKGIWVNKRTMHIHKQKEASAVWTVTHGLNKIPNVKVIDSTGELVFGTVKAGDANGNDMMNVVRICFGGVFAGSAYLD